MNTNMEERNSESSRRRQRVSIWIATASFLIVALEMYMVG